MKTQEEKEEAIQSYIRGLRNGTVTKINLNNFDLTDEEIAPLMEELKNCKSLDLISLSNNKLTSIRIPPIHIVSLNVSNNKELDPVLQFRTQFYATDPTFSNSAGII